MARFEGFLGTTYDTGVVDPNEVIAPPYDVVLPPERAELAARSPYNSILVELPEDPAGGDRYELAASLWRRWHDEGIVRVAAQPTFYVYRMTFPEEDGSSRSTTGVLGALGLDPQHSGDVLPHEETLPKDTHDRLSLLRATRTNLSPIWGLSLASGLGALAASAAKASAPSLSARDDSGTMHEMWAVADAGFIGEVASLVGSSPVLLADGHHRYQTACAYLAENEGSPGADAILALLVELAEDELTVQAIHRLVSGVSGPELLHGLSASFDLSPGEADPVALREQIASEGTLGLIVAGGSYLLTPRPELIEAAPDDLDSSRLAKALESVEGAVVTYQHGAREVADAVADGRAAGALLLRPVSVAQIARTAHGGRLMAPKTTFFYPKPRTGVVFRELDAG